MDLEEVLATWFAVDRTVVLENYDHLDDDYLRSWALALPRQAARVSAYWVQRTSLARTMGEWREVYQAWKTMCPEGLLLGPHLHNLDDPEMLDYSDLSSPLPDDAPFTVNEGFYDYVDGAGYTIQRQLAQDVWIPSEWAQQLGHPDDGFGMDYQPAELLYEPEDLLSKLAEEGIATGSAQELVHAVWDPDPLPATHEVLAWKPVPVDEYGNPLP